MSGIRGARNYARRTVYFRPHLTGMLITLIPLAAAILGLLLYALASNAKVAEIGRALLWDGVLVTLLAVAGRAVRLL